MKSKSSNRSSSRNSSRSSSKSSTSIFQKSFNKDLNDINLMLMLLVVLVIVCILFFSRKNKSSSKKNNCSSPLMCDVNQSIVPGVDESGNRGKFREGFSSGTGTDILNYDITAGNNYKVGDTGVGDIVGTDLSHPTVGVGRFRPLFI